MHRNLYFFKKNNKNVKILKQDYQEVIFILKEKCIFTLSAELLKGETFDSFWVRYVET